MMPDFHQLRREAIGHLETTGSATWTDYNTHDPGITLLEALAYAITELGYRAGFDIGDLLASAEPSQQAFFSARTILTVNPTTPDDARRLLVDLATIRNAWLRCDGRDGPRGLYEVLLELESDPDVGPLDDRTILRTRTVVAEDRHRPLVAELRFPPADPAHREQYRRLAGAEPFTFTVGRPNRTTTGTTPVTDAELQRHWSDVFYVDVAITFADGTPLAIDNAALRLFGDGPVRRRATVDDMVGWLEEPGEDGFLPGYRGKLAATDRAIGAARAVLHAHRNLAEDHCRIGLVEIIPIGVCADVEVEPGADIEAVQARIWYELERHLDPAVAFWSLQELLARGIPVEDVFNGPELASGFLTADGLAATDLRTDLRISDILNLLVDLDGVVSVANLQLTPYGPDGRPTEGADAAGGSWRLALPPDHRPRLHRRLSRFTFSANGLPFRPRTDEAEDILVQLHGRAARPPWPSADLDLPIPAGRARQLGSYAPVRDSLPVTYGIGPAGLPATASPLRRAQAKQLTGYLAVFDQLLRNLFAQLEHAPELFSLDPQVSQTYFSSPLDGTLDADALARLVEAPEDAIARRHRFLDHLLARFGESFGGHSRSLTDLQGTGIGHDPLIDKLGYLQAVPRLGHDRGRASDRSVAPTHPDNTSALHQRVCLLLGLPERTFARAGVDDRLELVEAGAPVLVAASADTTERDLLAAMALPDRYLVEPDADHWRVAVLDGADALIAEAPQEFADEPAADGFVARSAVWAAHQRAVVVEHLLLRPKFPGDAAWPDAADDDPYAFRLTYVLPGWTAPYSTIMEMRRFAERTIRDQAPSHLLVKTCWVGNDEDQFDGFEAAWCRWAEADAVIDWPAERLGDAVVSLLRAGAATPATDAALRACAESILASVGDGFRTWIESHLAAGTVPDPDQLDLPAILPCDGITLEPGAVEAIHALLTDRYASYTEVSYRLHVLVRSLADLRSTYPRTTLHDCDEGSDVNPVRLGQTVLGTN